MKNFYTIILVFFAFALFFGCQDDDENNMNDDINIEVCGVENPDWLVNQVDNILNKTSNYRPVQVSVYKKDSVEIISIEDPTNSNASEALMFFDCTGNKIDYSSLKYQEYSQLFGNDEFTRLWSN